MDCNKVGIFIATLRKEKEMTQQDLAFSLGVDKTTVCKWEKGRGFPDVALFPKIAQEFNVSVDELMNGERSESEAEKSELSLSCVESDENYGLTDEQFRIISKEVIRKRREFILQVTAIVAASVFLVAFLAVGIFSVLADIPKYTLDTWLRQKRDDYAGKISYHKDIDFLKDGYDLPTYVIEGYELYKIEAEDFFVSAKYKNEKGDEYAFSVCFYIPFSVHSGAMNGKQVQESLDIGDFAYYGNGSFTNASLLRRDFVHYMLDGIGTFLPEEECRKIFESISFTEYADEWVNPRRG